MLYKNKNEHKKHGKLYYIKNREKIIKRVKNYAKIHKKEKFEYYKKWEKINKNKIKKI